MAPASSAQREPSMEEILASIRRIIEDSDATQKRPDDPPARVAANEPLAAAKAEVEAFRAELRPVPEVALERHVVTPPAPAHAVELPLKAFRLAEVQAQVARETAAQFKAPEPPEPKAPEPEKRPVTLADVQQQLAKETVAVAAPTDRPRRADGSNSHTRQFASVEARPERPREPVALDVRREEPSPQASVVPAPAGRDHAQARDHFARLPAARSPRRSASSPRPLPRAARRPSTTWPSRCCARCCRIGWTTICRSSSSGWCARKSSAWRAASNRRSIGRTGRERRREAAFSLSDPRLAHASERCWLS